MLVSMNQGLKSGGPQENADGAFYAQQLWKSYGGPQSGWEKRNELGIDCPVCPAP